MATSNFHLRQEWIWDWDGSSEVFSTRKEITGIWMARTNAPAVRLALEIRRHHTRRSPVPDRRPQTMVVNRPRSRLTVNINSTTGGKHINKPGQVSAHYSGRAVDINYVNAQHVSALNAASKILQDAMAAQRNNLENFGPHAQTKALKIGGARRQINSVREEHQNHDHFSSWR
jgi:hypothetical protein